MEAFRIVSSSSKSKLLASWLVETFEALMILLSAKPKIFLLLPGAFPLNSFVCCNVVLVKFVC